MKSNFEERKENRLQAYQNLKFKNAQQSESHFNTAHKIGSHIPFGQPILVGHHSEKRHRADANRIDNNMRKGVEADKKAAYYADKIESILSNKAISSDDPNAIDKLTEKLERLEMKQQIMKDVNKLIKSKGTQAEKIVKLVALGFNEERAAKFFVPDYCGRIGFESYTLTNNNATIRNTKQRIEQLKKIEALESTEEIINGITIKVNVEDNRVQVFFPTIPSEDTRKKLKSSGFHWSPSVGAWMRQISSAAIWTAKDVVSSVK